MSTPAVFSGRQHVAFACGAELGEGPVWDGRAGRLLFVDILGRALLHGQPNGALDRVDLSERAGFLVLTPDPAIVLVGLRSGLARLDIHGGAPSVLVRPEADQPGNRLNDGTVGPDGSLYFGTMDEAEKEASGRFYRWSGPGLSRFGGPAIVTNGPAIDPERRVLYASDTVDRQVYRHRLDADGAPGPAEPFVQLGAGDGHPDGMAVDAEGHVWIAHWGGSRVTRFSPDGQPVLVVPVPTAQVTKPAFGGPDLSTLFVTTAARGRDRETDPMAGHVFAFEVGIRGLAAAPCTVPA